MCVDIKASSLYGAPHWLSLTAASRTISIYSSSNPVIFPRRCSFSDLVRRIRCGELSLSSALSFRRSSAVTVCRPLRSGDKALRSNGDPRRDFGGETAPGDKSIWLPLTVNGEVLLGCWGAELVDGVLANGDNGIAVTDFRRGEWTTCGSFWLIPWSWP